MRKKKKNYRTFVSAVYLISLIFGIEIDHVTADTRQTFKVKGSKAKVTA